MGTPGTVVLVEGESDRVALLVLARRRGLDLGARGVEVVAMSGITNLRAHALRHGPRGRGLALAGLYDAPEESVVRRGLATAGVAAADDLEAAGFFRCCEDLEDELIRALGVDAVETVIEAEGEARSLTLLSGMPAQRGWSREALLHGSSGCGRGGRRATPRCSPRRSTRRTCQGRWRRSSTTSERVRAGGKGSLGFVAGGRRGGNS